MSILFLRRKGLGLGSIQGMKSLLTGSGTTSHLWTTNHRKHRDNLTELPTLLVRWGVTTSLSTLVFPTQTTAVKIYNPANAISKVNSKAQFRKELLDNPTVGQWVPTTVVIGSQTQEIPDSIYPVIVRPSKHAQGRNLWVANNYSELQDIFLRKRNLLASGGYISKLIPKQKEYRVYVFDGRVASVAEKIPHDRNQVAWNVAQGGEFRVVNWGEWPLEAIRASVDCFRLSGLNFGGVDVIISEEGNPYVIEINSAPSLPHLSDGRVSYRQSVMAKCFAYAHGKVSEGMTDTWIEPAGYSDWREVIHPAVNHNAIIN